MSKEILKIDEELTQEFNQLIEEEGRKIEPEEQLKKALWALDVLKQENKINSETTLDELVQIIEERQKELRETNAYAKSTAGSSVVDEADAELHKVAKEEAETAKRLINYMDAAWAILQPMKMSEYYLDNRLKDVRSRLESSLKVRENQTEYDEERQRNGEK